MITVRKTLLILMVFAVVILTGCEGTGGAVGFDGNVVGTASANNSLGWEHFDSGNYDMAITAFQTALNQNPTNTQETVANTGIGWAYAKKGDVANSITNFSKVQNTNNDANIGLGGAYLARGQQGDFEKIITLYEWIDVSGGGLKNYASSHTGVTAGEALAVLAYAEYISGDSAKAKTRMNEAIAIEPNNDGVNDIKAVLTNLGLTLSKLPVGQNQEIAAKIFHWDL